MITCAQACSLITRGVNPGTSRNGNPELGFHLALCAACRSIWNDRQQAPAWDEDHERLAPVLELTDDYGPAAVQVHSAHGERIDQFGNDASADQHETQSTADTYTVWDVAAPASQVHSGLHQREPQLAEATSTQPGVTYRALLQNRNFRKLWLGQAISTFGSYFTRIAIPIYVFNLTSSYAQLGLAAFSSLAASLLFGLVAGALVDRYDPRRIMIAADLANGALMLALLALVSFPIPLTTKLASVYFVNFAAALVREMFNPARVAIFADVVTDAELLAANSLDQATTTFAELLSYPLAALALFSLGTSGAFLIDALTFFLSAVLILGVRTQYSARTTTSHTSIWREIAEGVAAVQQLPLVRIIAILSLILPLLISLFNTLQLPYVVEALGSTQDVGFPVLEGVMTLGIASGVLALGRWGQQVPRGALLWYGIFCNGLAYTLQGLVPILGTYANISPALPSSGPWTSLFFLALPFAWLTGASNSLIFISIRTVLQEQTPREVLGRVASVIGTAAGLGFAMGALLTGVAQGRVALVITVIGVLFVGIGLACRSRLPSDSPAAGPKYYSW